MYRFFYFKSLDPLDPHQGLPLSVEEYMCSVRSSLSADFILKFYAFYCFTTEKQHEIVILYGGGVYQLVLQNIPGQRSAYLLQSMTWGGGGETFK